MEKLVSVAPWNRIYTEKLTIAQRIKKFRKILLFLESRVLT
jgi:hypothetical protein